MPEECLICKEPLKYLDRDEMMECAFCHKKEPSKAHCVNRHYICDECHMNGAGALRTVNKGRRFVHACEVVPMNKPPLFTRY